MEECWPSIEIVILMIVMCLAIPVLCMLVASLDGASASSRGMKLEGDPRRASLRGR